VPVAARDLVSGAVLDPGDVVLRQVPRALAPQHSVTAAVGRILAGPVRAGEPITDVRLVSSSLLSGFPGRVALPVRIADPDAVGLLRAGDHIDLVAADPRRGTASYVAVEVPVLSLPPPTADAASAGTPGRLVVVAVTTSEVDDIAGAAASDLLSVVISR
jgi:Flp pilus assembly protein CpaB